MATAPFGRFTIDRVPTSVYLQGMEVRFSPEEEAEIAKLASQTGKNPPEFVQQAMRRMLSDRARFLAGVQRGIDAAERGDFIDHEDVAARIERLFHS